jgi:flagellar L-ring protein FlgH
MRSARSRKALAARLAAALLVFAPSLHAQLLHKLKFHSQPKTDALAAYLDRAREWSVPFKPSGGSLWNPDGRMSDLATDAKARYRGDVVQIQLAENTSSALQGSVQTQRTYAASSGIAAFFGLPAATSPVGNMFSPSSSQALNGKGQTALSTSLTTTLAANVVEVLPNGQLVIEATRDVEVSDQRETMVLHGVIRPQDISPANAVSSTAISHMEVNLTGKGVITEGTHPPNGIVRVLLRVVGF